MEFGSNAANNTVLTDWFDSPNNPAAGVTVINNGLNNCVRNTADLYNDQVLLAVFNGSTLRTNGTKCNVLGFSTGVAFDNDANTVTANQLIDTSPLIQIAPNNQYFNVVTEFKLSGGIRMKIDAFDINMNPIASTDGGVLYHGASNANAGFSENSTKITNSLGTRRIHIKNQAARWLKLTVNASSTGYSFRRFEFSAITSSKFGKYELMTSAYVSGV